MNREAIMALVSRHCASTPAPFIPGETYIPTSGRVYDANDVRSAVDAALDFWLTAGRYATAFETSLAEHFGIRHVSLCNSGSSANLLAVSALTSHRLGDKRLRPGDEVITVAATFPTTVAAILQNNLIPVFIDVDLGTYNAIPEQVEAAVGERTRAIILAHALGNPFDVAAVMTAAKQHDLWAVEDACDALGSTYDSKQVGAFGDLATCSFYPAHHITTGEGGCVATNSPLLATVVESFRDWGRDCWCETGKDNTCGKRFGWQLGDLPEGYDHKYIYSHIGYNLKMTDLQAAIGVSQIRKLESFCDRRRSNFRRLYDGLRDLEHLFLLPRATPGSDPSWFGFPITVREDIRRLDVVHWLEDHKVGTRQFFGGNLLRQPAFVDVPRRIIGDLPNSDTVTNQTFWVGVYPGITDAMINYMIDIFHKFRPRARL